MKQLLIFSFCLLNALISQAQHRISAGITLASQLSRMKITQSKIFGPQTSIYDKGGIAPGYSIGVQVEYNLNSDCFLRSGLSYEKAVHRYLVKGLVFETDLINGTMSTEVNNSSIYSFDLPLDFGYRFTTSREGLNILIGVGGIMHFITDTRSSGYIRHDVIEDEKLHTVKNQISPASYSAVFFGGVEYAISQRLMFGLEPFLKYTPNKFVLDIYHSEAESAIQLGLAARLKIR
jgi:hypothetical protein